MTNQANFRYTKKCEYCGKEFGVNKKQEFIERRYCSSVCCYADPARRKRVSDTIKKRPKREITEERRAQLRAAGAKRAMQRHEKWLDSKATVRNGWGKEKNNFLDITNRQLQEYRKQHQFCEICGRAEVVTVNNQFVKSNKPIALSADHDHSTGHFRGVLCRRCNRALGWYDKYKDNIVRYLDGA